MRSSNVRDVVSTGRHKKQILIFPLYRIRTAKKESYDTPGGKFFTREKFCIIEPTPDRGI